MCRPKGDSVGVNMNKLGQLDFQSLVFCLKLVLFSNLGGIFRGFDGEGEAFLSI